MEEEKKRYEYRTAITRKISSKINSCELTHITRNPIDLPLALEQHKEYVQTLKNLGLNVIELPEEPDLPDSVFVEDAAFILPEIGIITMPGALSRRPEIITISNSLAPLLPLIRIELPGTIDGGDVLVIGKQIYVGLSTRSNEEAVEQLQRKLKDYNYQVHAIKVEGCLHSIS